MLFTSKFCQCLSVGGYLFVRINTGICYFVYLQVLPCQESEAICLPRINIFCYILTCKSKAAAITGKRCDVTQQEAQPKWSHCKCRMTALVCMCIALARQSLCQRPNQGEGSDWLWLIWSTSWKCNWSPDTCTLTGSLSVFHAFEHIWMHYLENKDCVLWLVLISQLHNRECDKKTRVDLINIMPRYVPHQVSLVRDPHPHSTYVSSSVCLSLTISQSEKVL